MSLIDLFIRRPILTLMLTLSLLVFGLLGEEHGDGRGALILRHLQSHGIELCCQRSGRACLFGRPYRGAHDEHGDRTKRKHAPISADMFRHDDTPPAHT